MTDIVERLRAMAQGEARSGIGRQRRDLFAEAADEIERLREELSIARQELMFVQALALQTAGLEDQP
jgi:hypothetical protein